MADDDWDKALAEGPGPVKLPVQTYELHTFVNRDGKLYSHDVREKLSWPSVCGILGNSGEGDITTAVVKRDGVVVLRYNTAGLK